MKFRDYVEQYLTEAEEIPAESQIKTEIDSSDKIEDVGEGVEMVPESDLPKDVADVDNASAEAKWAIDGAKDVESAWVEYNKAYIPKLLKDTARTSGIGKGKFYTIGITSLKLGKLGNAEIHDTDEKEVGKKDAAKLRRLAFLLVGQCRVKDIGVMEGFFKKYVLGVRIQLIGDASKKKIGSWLSKLTSKLDPGNKKFKHIKTATNEFATALGENEFAVPVHWIPRLREAIEESVSTKHKKAEDAKEEAKEKGEKFVSDKSVHVAKGKEGLIKVGGRETLKLPPIGKR